MIIPEVWVPVVGFYGYEVSDLGGVRTYRPRNGQGDLLETPRLLNPRSSKGKEYLRVTLTNTEGRQVDRKVHLLVLEAFCGPRPTLEHDACHGPTGATDNRLLNLRWGTKQENAKDRIDHGTQLRGEQIHTTQLNTDQVALVKAEIPNWKRGMCTMFAEKFGVYPSTIAAIRSGKTWCHV